MGKNEAEKIQRHHTQRAAERAVEAELNRRGISTAQTDMNEPGIDLVAFRPMEPPIPIQVKGLQERNEWLIAPPTRDDTIYVLVHVPTGHRKKPGVFQYFILTALEMHKEMERYHKHLKYRPTWKPSIPWRYSVLYENCWDKLWR